MRPSRLLALLYVVLPLTLLAACASGGGVPRPQPFPGAPVATVATPEPAATPPAVMPAVPGVVATALTLQGTPYRNGGTDPRGFDCSGLVQWVFAQHGATLPRQTSEQFTVGERVDPGDIRAGDLVFFSTVSRGASHVGIALGDGRFLHAPSSRGVVRVERYQNNSYWSRRFVGARRVADAESTLATSALPASGQAD